jgi:hypothetical protein
VRSTIRLLFVVGTAASLAACGGAGTAPQPIPAVPVAVAAPQGTARAAQSVGATLVTIPTSVTYAPGTITLTNTSGAAQDISDVELTFTDTDTIASVWGTPWMAWTIAQNGTAYTLVGGSNTAKWAAGAKLTVQYTAGAGTPANVVLAAIVAPPLVPFTVSASESGGTITIVNTSGAPIPLRKLELDFTYAGTIASAWGTPWIAWTIARSGNAYRFTGGTSDGTTLAAGASMSVSFTPTAGANATGIVLKGITSGAVASASPSSKPSPSPAPSSKPSSTPSPSPTATATTVAGSGSRGTIYYHFYPPVTSTTGLLEDLSLAGDNYTDLIASNFIAGVMLGHTIGEDFPGVQFNKDYLYGTMFGQLLQENIETSLYSASSTLIDPSPLQAAVMGAGQGGPFQINNYDVDLFNGGYSPQGYALLNYVAVQKNIGFTFAQAPSQFSAPTPATFNNKYYGPMLTTYFHLNDLRSLQALGQTTYSPAPSFNACLNALKSIPNAPLDIIINEAYNQGYYGGLVAQSTASCAANAAAFAATANSYANAAGDSYHEYPYQVRFYLDELYNRSTIAPQTANHVIFNVAALGTIFANVASTLAVPSGGGDTFISASTALAAYTSAAQSAGAGATLDLSDPVQRPVLFGVLERAVTNLESALGTTFAQTTLSQL